MYERICVGVRGVLEQLRAEVWQMTVKELTEKLKKCRDDSEAIIVEIDDSWIEIHHIKGVVVADTGEALISVGVKND
jgi:hypothetical protein